MRAVGVARKPDEVVVEVRDVPQPTPGPDDLLVRVHAAGVMRNFLGRREDLARTMSPALAARQIGPNAPEFSILGREFAGEVVAVGSGVPSGEGRDAINFMNPAENMIGFAIGDRVMAHVGGSNGPAIGAPDGGQAEYAVVNHRLVSRVPDGLSWVDAGAIPYGYTIATDALVQSDLRCGERVLVHAVSGAIGSAAFQLAKAMGASMVIGTAGSDEKVEKAKALGLDVGVNYRTQDFAEEISKATGGRGVDVIIDHIGGPYFDQHARCLALKGRWVHLQSSLGSSNHKVTMNMAAFAGRRQTFRGSVIGSLPLEDRAITVRNFEEIALPHLATGKLKAVVDKVYSFDQAAEAYAYMSAAAHGHAPDATGPLFGKVVLVPELVS